MFQPAGKSVRQRQAMTLSLLALLLSLPPPVACGNPDSSFDSSKSVFLNGKIDTFGILSDQLQTRLGITCKKDQSSGVCIRQVRPESEAYNKGLRAGDTIEDAWQDSKQFCLRINRAGHIYEAHLDLQVRVPRLLPESPTADLIDPQHFMLRASRSAASPITQKSIRVLANYQLEIIIDRSLSMRRHDCPGGLSRWDWCSEQATAVAKALSPYVASGLTITRFASDFDVHHHANAQSFIDILGQHDFQFGTRLCEPLADRFDEYFARRKAGAKPLLIAVITDGRPWPPPEPFMVKDELVYTSQRMSSPGEVTVLFLQIGDDDPRGERYLLNLGNNLVSSGARYQFVQTRTFEELQSTGLAQALVNAVVPTTTASRLSGR